MKSNPLLPLAAALCSLFTTVNPALAQGTAFTYQGRLTDGGFPANGSYDLSFAVFAVETSGIAVAGPLTNSTTAVSNGLFTVTLDFGAGVFTGADRFLEIGARTNGGGMFSTLVPRQKLTPAPYAIFSANAGSAASATVFTGAIADSQLSGNIARLNSNATFTGAVTFNNAANNFTGNGAGLTNLNASQLASGTVPDARLSTALRSNTFWRLDGNGGTTAGTHFLGTTDNQPLEIKVNGMRALRLENNGDSSSDSDGVPDGAPNVIGGSPANVVGAGVVGATIAGGGATNYIRVDIFGFYTLNSNRISADFATISGGANNLIEADAGLATVGGGAWNYIQANAGNATIGGGLFNTIHSNALFATIGGGLVNSAQGIGSVIGGGGYDGTLFSVGNSTRGNASVIAGGVGNAISNISAYTAIGGGENNTIAENSSHSAIGGGENNTIVDNAPAATIPGGREARAANYGQLAYASGAFAAVGDAQTSVHVLRGTTSNTNQTEIFLDGISRRMIVPTDSTWAFDILIVARTSSSLSGAYHIRGVIENNGGTTALDGTLLKDILNEDVAVWDVSVEANNTADALVIKVNGSATPVRWVASVRTVEITFP